MLSPVKQAAALQHGQHIVLYEKKKSNKAVSEKGSSPRFSEYIRESGEAEMHITASGEGRWSRAP